MEELKVTSPEEYAAIVERKQAGCGEFVPLPSGIVVRARRADMEGMALKGGLPMSLVSASQALSESGEKKELTVEQIEEGQKALIFMRELTRKNCIEPQIVYDETGEVIWQWPNGATREIETEDFKALAAWVRGEEVDQLDSFRQPNRKTRRASASKSGGKTLRNKTLSPVERVIAGS